MFLWVTLQLYTQILQAHTAFGIEGILQFKKKKKSQFL